MTDTVLQNLNTVGKYSQQRPILAAIDIGTNSLHMVVVEIKPELPAFSVIAREKDTVRLGDRDPQTGNLNAAIRISSCTAPALSGALAIVIVKSQGGVQTFDNGSLTLTYE